MKAIEMPHGINIERVRLTDRRQIEDIEQSSGIEPWTDDDWNRETRSSNSGWLVARDGFWSMCPVAGYVLFHLKHEFAEIRRLVVRREYRRRGIAERLIARAEQSIVLASATMAEGGKHFRLSDKSSPNQKSREGGSEAAFQLAGLALYAFHFAATTVFSDVLHCSDRINAVIAANEVGKAVSRRLEDVEATRITVTLREFIFYS